MTVRVDCLHLIEKTLSGESINHWQWDPTDFCVDVYYHLHIQDTSLFSCDLCWLQRVARGNGNHASLPESGQIGQKGQFKRYTVRNLPKFASVPELKQFLLEIYSVEQSPATNYSFTVGYMSDGRTKRDIKTDKQCKWTALKMQISK